MQAGVLKLKPFETMYNEFKPFPKHLHKAYGHLPGRARFKKLREFSTGLLDKITPVALTLSTFELLCQGTFGSSLQKFLQRVFEPINETSQSGIITIKNHNFLISYFTAATLLTAFATKILNLTIATRPQNEQSRSLNAIRHLWGDLAKVLHKKNDKDSFTETNLREAVTYLSALKSQQEAHPEEFKQTLTKPIASYFDKPEKISKFLGLMHLHLYNLNNERGDLEMVISYLKKAQAMDHKGKIQNWYSTQVAPQKPIKREDTDSSSV